MSATATRVGIGFIIIRHVLLLVDPMVYGVSPGKSHVDERVTLELYVPAVPHQIHAIRFRHTVELGCFLQIDRKSVV